MSLPSTSTVTAASSITTEESISKGLLLVNDKLNSTYLKCISDGTKNTPVKQPRMVAVTKSKPIEDIVHAYKQGQRHFGENFVQELVIKSQHPMLVGCDDICWHFIGHLQRNKCNNLVSSPNLWAVETVDSERLASTLDNSWKKIHTDRKLNVFVQINTSGEESKHGCERDAAPALVRHIIEQCDSLKFCGLMTIGKSGHDYSTGPNPDFDCLVDTRRRLCEDLKIDVTEVELSMGMSSDFEQAICAGSTNIRVGSMIFGSRKPKETEYT